MTTSKRFSQWSISILFMPVESTSFMSLADIVGVDVTELTISGVNGSGISGDGDGCDILRSGGESVAVEVET
jgi:hypothetical protein